MKINLNKARNKLIHLEDNKFYPAISVEKFGEKAVVPNGYGVYLLEERLPAKLIMTFRNKKELKKLNKNMINA